MKRSRYDFTNGPWSTLRRSWSITLLALVLQSLPVRAQTTTSTDNKTNFSFVDGAAITISPDGAGVVKFDTPVKNSGASGTATAALLGDNCTGTDASLTPTALPDLGPNAVAITRFTISGVTLPRTCYVELVSAGGTSLKQIKLAQNYATWTISLFLLGCLVVSSVVAYCASHEAEKDWKFSLGNPGWDFAKSWTSTTTLVGGIISTALALSALPELTRYASKSGYSILALLISLAVIVAPFIFTGSMNGVVHREKDGKYSVEYKGPLSRFTISCAVTLFAGLAQLFVFFFLLHEIFQGYVFWPAIDKTVPLINLGLVPTVILAAILCSYAYRSILLTVTLQKAANTNADDLKAANKNKVAPEHVGSPMLTWPVL